MITGILGIFGQYEMTIASIISQTMSLIIEPAGAHKFAYTRIREETGEAVWCWPNEKPISQLVEAQGQILDITA